MYQTATNLTTFVWKKVRPMLSPKYPATVAVGSYVGILFYNALSIDTTVPGSPGEGLNYLIFIFAIILGICAGGFFNALYVLVIKIYQKTSEQWKKEYQEHVEERERSMIYEKVDGALSIPDYNAEEGMLTITRCESCLGEKRNEIHS